MRLRTPPRGEQRVPAAQRYFVEPSLLTAAELFGRCDDGLDAEDRQAREQGRAGQDRHGALGDGGRANGGAGDDEDEDDRPEQSMQVLVRAVEDSAEGVQRRDGRGRDRGEQRLERQPVDPCPVRRCCCDHEPDWYRPTSHAQMFGARPEGPPLPSRDLRERSAEWPMCR